MNYLPHRVLKFMVSRCLARSTEELKSYHLELLVLDAQVRVAVTLRRTILLVNDHKCDAYTGITQTNIIYA